VDTIIQVILLIICAWLAYAAVSNERRTRALMATSALGWYLAAFGGISFGVLYIWNNWLSPKLTDTFPSESDLLIGGIVVLAALVVFALDLLGKIDIVGQLQQSINKASTGRPAGPTGPSGDD
jgi:hypothetical protein